jgi:predicted dehydrogenase
MQRSPFRRVANCFWGSLAVLSTLAASGHGQEDRRFRLGIIGLDTSHVSAFSSAIAKAHADTKLGKLKVVAAFPGGSPDIPSSINRVEGFTRELQDKGVEIVGTIPELIAKVDGVLLESVDGRPHLAQVLPVFKAKKPVFIDKPLAGNLSDALAIDLLSKKYGTPWFTSSSLRFSQDAIRWRKEANWPANVVGAATWGACSIDPHHPDLFFYGIHGLEALYTVMGPGCQQVVSTATNGTHAVIGKWPDGRIGTYRGLRAGKQEFGMTVFGTNAVVTQFKYEGYEPLLQQIAEFFLDKSMPVSNAESIELIAFMQAAQVSQERGTAVLISEVMEEARAKVQARLAEIDR